MPDLVKDQRDAGMGRPDPAEVLARSDAAFDGRDFDRLGRADRERYLNRAAKGLSAVGAVQPQVGEARGGGASDVRQDARVQDFLRYLHGQGGDVSATDRCLDQWEADRGEPVEPDDTINLAFNAGLAEQVGERFALRVAITPAGAKTIGLTIPASDRPGARPKG